MVNNGFTNYWINKILDHIFGLASYTAETPLYIGLCSGAVGADGTITGEPADVNNYARCFYGTTSTNWNNATTLHVKNKVNFTFNVATGSWAGGSALTNFFISTSATTNTNTVAYGGLQNSKIIGTGDTASFAIGDLDVTMTNST